MQNRPLVLSICCVFSLLHWLSIDSPAQQLSREVREKFETLADELNGSLQLKFQRAIDNNTPIVELTPTEFRAFRNNPANPFDIGEINTDRLRGNIELRFELPSLRERRPGEFERQNESLKRGLRSTILAAARSTVQITDGRQQVALGTVVDADGYVVTKASEIENLIDIRCRTFDGRVSVANVVKIDSAFDIALLRVDSDRLIPISFSERQPAGGAFLVTPDHRGEAISLGSYSVVPRSTVGENQGFLGVAPRTAPGGVRIGEAIEANTAAYAAGLKVGDVITAIDGRSITEAYQLAEEIRRRSAGEKIQIDFVRSGRVLNTTAKLAGRSLNGERAARFKMMSRLGAIPSDRDTSFPSVFQHDSPLFPEQCGGPICDLDGNVIGVNIARESRASSFAIPSSQLKSIIQDLLRHAVAARGLRPR